MAKLPPFLSVLHLHPTLSTIHPLYCKMKRFTYFVLTLTLAATAVFASPVAPKSVNVERTVDGSSGQRDADLVNMVVSWGVSSYEKYVNFPNSLFAC